LTPARAAIIGSRGWSGWWWRGSKTGLSRNPTFKIVERNSACAPASAELFFRPAGTVNFRGCKYSVASWLLIDAGLKYLQLQFANGAIPNLKIAM
jgi:hypothetical protein